MQLTAKEDDDAFQTSTIDGRGRKRKLLDGSGNCGVVGRLEEKWKFI
jgi:hypothetical protein